MFCGPSFIVSTMQEETTPIFKRLWYDWTQQQPGIEPTNPLGQCWVPPIVAFYDQQGLLRTCLLPGGSIRSPHPGSHTTTLRDLWGKINTIEGRPPKEPHHPDPMGMAVELALKFTSLTNPTHLPKLHQKTLEDLQPERLRNIQAAIGTPSRGNLDRPLTMTELNDVLHNPKYKAPGTDGITTVVLSMLSPINNEALLQVMDNAF